MAPDEGLARDLLGEWGIRPRRLEFLGHSANVVWRVDGDLVLRISEGAERAGFIPSEIVWLADLTKRGLHVPSALERHDGSWTARRGEAIGSVFTYFPGEIIPFDAPERIDAAWARKAGELTARLHEAAEKFVPPPGFDRPNADRIHEADERPDGEVSRAIGRDFGLEELFLAVIQAADAWGLRQPRRLLHADLHQANLLTMPDGTLAAIDFDDCGFAPTEYDLAVFLAETRDVGREDVHAAYLEAYRAHRTADDAGIALYEAHRFAALLGWMAVEPEHPVFAGRREEWAERLRRRIEERLRVAGVTTRR